MLDKQGWQRRESVTKQAVRPAAVERGRAVELAPRVPEPREWLVERFDWESTVTVVDMFSGAGGMSLGFDSVPGMAVVGAFEQDGRAAETHAANIAGAVFTGDVNTIISFEAILRETGIRRVDILIGGPPCQGFSKLGKRAPELPKGHGTFSGKQAARSLSCI